MNLLYKVFKRGKTLILAFFFFPNILNLMNIFSDLLETKFTLLWARIATDHHGIIGLKRCW